MSVVSRKPRTVCCIVGAGHSYVGGFPLTQEFFDKEALILTKGSEKRFYRVWSDFDAWRGDNPGKNAEEYIGEIYHRERWWGAPSFGEVVELVAAVLSMARGPDARATNPRYVVRLTNPCGSHVLRSFWREISNLFSDIRVVTTNYDILIERCLRHRAMKRLDTGGFYYAGLRQPQTAKGSALPWKKDENRLREVRIEGTTPVAKIHGSLNWALENDDIVLFQDYRAALRGGCEAAIIPPIPEKETPHWLQTVWMEAERFLSEADCWLICGYSLPEYDVAVRGLMKRGVKTGRKKIAIIDPLSKKLQARWEEFAVEVICLGGLPGAINEIRKRLG